MTKILELLQVLADRGLSDDAIVNVRDGLWAQANETFLNDVLTSLSDGDLQMVESSGTQEEANEKLGSLYQEKTGRSVEEEMQKIVEQFATELIEKYSTAELTGPRTDLSDMIGDHPKNGTESFDEVTGKEEDEEKVHDLT